MKCRNIFAIANVRKTAVTMTHNGMKATVAPVTYSVNPEAVVVPILHIF